MRAMTPNLTLTGYLQSLSFVVGLCSQQVLDAFSSFNERFSVLNVKVVIFLNKTKLHSHKSRNSWYLPPYYPSISSTPFMNVATLSEWKNFKVKRKVYDKLTLWLSDSHTLVCLFDFVGLFLQELPKCRAAVGGLGEFLFFLVPLALNFYAQKFLFFLFAHFA